MRGSLATLVLLCLVGGCASGGRRGTHPPADAGVATEDASPTLPDAGPLDAAPNVPVDAGPTFPPGTTCTPGFGCPAGSVFRLDGAYGRCLWEGVELPVAPDVRPYCSYLDRGVLGFSWRLSGSTGSSYRCPTGTRYAPNDTLGYCLWEDFVHPGAASADCDELLTGGRIGFRWRCPE